MRKLSDYPELIADVATDLNEVDAQIRKLRGIQESYETIADGIAATDNTLKNDSQRRAFKHQYLQDQEDYQQAQTAIEALSRDRYQLSTTLERLRNEFSVAKLEMRLQIATTLAGIEDKQLVDSSL